MTAGYVPSPAEMRKIDRDYARWQRQHPHAGGLTDVHIASVPASQPAIVSLPTGTDVAPARAAGGLGELTVINGTGQDAVVKLAEPMSADGPLVACRTVFIKAKEQYTIGRIGEGTYTLFFAQGDDWDQSAQTFRQNDTYSQFENLLTFKETTTRTENDGGYQTGTHYSTFTVTLNPVLDGNARATSTDKAAFDALR